MPATASSRSIAMRRKCRPCNGARSAPSALPCWSGASKTAAAMLRMPTTHCSAPAIAMASIPASRSVNSNSRAACASCIRAPSSCAMRRPEKMPRTCPPSQRQSGASLLIALILLGVAAARTALMNEKSSRNDRDRQIAFAAAEAALRDAELSMAGVRGQPAAFPTQAGQCHPNGEFGGLCRTGAVPLWSDAGMLMAPPSVEFGRYSGGSFPYGAASLAMQPPRYLVELFSLAAPGKTGVVVQRYRITAIGFGPRAGTRVVLQAVYAFADRDTQTARLSWREVGNWQENAATTP